MNFLAHSTPRFPPNMPPQNTNRILRELQWIRSRIGALTELSQARDAQTGAFKAGSSMTPAALRSAYGAPGRNPANSASGRDVLKRAVMAAIRSQK
jgi:hypothetical protein